ncbi:histidine kinase [Marivirga sp. S37H4]|uniref:Histidine kinase n=1 Tax=Marivirga aurantiaca TaxID=2802615 RepID=A0A935CAU0_9BACT|nr:histidine kinase [Marivirga aurantiaca]MBK6266951.1 histidine kinase [Marivirga aurantiaca]
MISYLKSRLFLGGLKFGVLFLLLVSNKPLFCFELEEADSTSIETILVKSNKLLYNKTDSAKILAEEALNLSTQINYQRGIANSLNVLGVTYDINGDFAKSFSTYKEAVEIYNRIGDERGAANCQANMAILLKQDGKYDEALVYLSNSHDYYVKSDDKKHMASSLMTIGNLLLAKGDNLNNVMSKLEEAEAIVRNLNDTILICSSVNLQGDAYLKFNKLPEAIARYQTAIDIIKNLDKPWNRGYSHLGLAKSYLKSNQLDHALQNCVEGLKQYGVIHHKFGIMELYEIRVAINEKQNDLPQAIANLRIAQMYKDSIYNEKQSKQISHIKVEYETEKKEAEIASLSQQAEIKDLEIRQKNQTMVIGLIAISLITAVVYFVYRQRKFKDQQSRTELEQRFLRSQLNPHFISNALMAVQNFMLKNEAEKASTYLAKFSKLMREILENSRQEFIPVEDEIQMLTNYLDIHRLRMNESFDYNVEIDENIDVETDTIPPMFVQPFVENAIEHGIINAKGQGLIVLKLVKEGEYIAIEISDNGGGLIFGAQKIDHNSLSTTIIQERMALFNKSLKNKIQLIWDNIKDEHGEIQGTKVELKVPFSYL